MAVVIDFEDPRAIAQAGQNAFANRPRPQQQVLPTQYAPEINAENLPGDTVDLGNGQSGMADARGQVQPLAQTSPRRGESETALRLQPDGSLAGNNYYAGPDSDAAKAAQAKAGMPTIKTKLADGSEVLLTGAQAALRDQANQKTEQQQGQFDARQKQQQGQFDAKYQQGDDQFWAKMQDVETKRQSQSADLKAKLQSALDIANQKTATAGDKERLGMTLKIHESQIGTAKQALANAQKSLQEAYANYRSVQANKPWDQAALKEATDPIDKAKAEVEKAAQTYDANQKELQADLEGHIQRMGGNAKQGAQPNLQMAHDLGATDIVSEEAAGEFLKAAKAGKVATKDDVFRAMTKAKGDKKEAVKALQGQGFVFDRFGSSLEAMY